MTAGRPYHHGDLRRALLAVAAEAIAERGVAALSLRELARRAGVSHAAPAHHFGDKSGLLTALAVEGYELLGRALHDARASTGSFLEMGVAYVTFAVQHPAHFQVMFRADLHRAHDPRLAQARQLTGDALRRGAAELPDAGFPADSRLTGLAAWSLVHGFATLWLGGTLPDDLGDDPAAAARSVIRLLRS